MRLAVCFTTCFVSAFLYAESEVEIGMKDALQAHFLVGAAVNDAQMSGRETAKTEIIKRHFNSIVAENVMKTRPLQPREGEYNFAPADRFVEFGRKNNMAVIGHALLWHEQIPSWFCVDNEGNAVSPEVLKGRIRSHILSVVGRYKGMVKGWDVVNEAILDNGEYRRSPFYEILGEEYLLLAFQYAREADPDAELYYNDYGMTGSLKCSAVVKMVEKLKQSGIRIDAVGMQFHIDMERPKLDEIEKSLELYASTGCKVMITEWDMRAIPSAWGLPRETLDNPDLLKKYNPYPDGLPEDVAQRWSERMKDILNILKKHSDVITRVSFWGVSDGDSWLNDIPLKGRTDYPLPFDRQLRPKPFVMEILDDAKSE